MNEFFTHQALQKNSDSLDKLNAYLQELKTLTNGDLARIASDELARTETELLRTKDDIRAEFMRMSDAFTGMVTSVRIEQELNFGRYYSFLKMSWILLVSTVAINIGVLCFVVMRAH